MKITISDKKKKDIFNSIFNLLKSSSSQINAIFENNKLHIQGIDKSHVCLFELNLTDKWFEQYNVTSKQEICFNTSIFYSMISTKSDEQSLVIKKENDDSLIIELINLTKNTDYSKYFFMPLLEYEYNEMNIPSTDFEAEFSLPSKKITDILSQLSNFGDNINIKCSQDCVDFKTTGNSGDMRVNILVDDMTNYAIVEDEQLDITYSLLYINKMCITNKLSNNVDFSISKEYPMKIHYDLGDDSSLVFYIAPKLSDD
jgi:proliferating cell nuclear antigen